jgi:hypothetical protein
MGSVFPASDRFSSAVTFYGVCRGRKAAVHAQPSKIHNAGGGDGCHMSTSSHG